MAEESLQVVLDIKKRLAKVHRIMTAGGLWPITKGHVSAWVPGTDRICMLGHLHAEGRTLDTTDVDDIITIDPDGNKVEGWSDPAGERFIHTAVLRARPDVNAVVHTHSTYATAFGIAGVNILPVGNRGSIFSPMVPILEYDRQIETPETGEMVREALGDGYALVLRNHGTVSVGDTVENACIVAFALEETAHLQWLATALGPPQKISTAERKSVLTGKRKEEFFSHVWAHYEAMDPWNKRS
jgi:L-ribulose-5-phosphate 4-epimerase